MRDGKRHRTCTSGHRYRREVNPTRQSVEKHSGATSAMANSYSTTLKPTFHLLSGRTYHVYLHDCAQFLDEL